MENIRRITDHIQESLQIKKEAKRWQVPSIIQSREGADYIIHTDGSFWRALTLIGGAKTYPTIINTMHAREAGYALGHFQRLISDIDPALLHDTLPGYHVTPRYLSSYDKTPMERKDSGGTL